MICWRNAESVMRRSFSASMMKRRLIFGPNPCRRCWVIVARRFVFKRGRKRGELAGVAGADVGVVEADVEERTGAETLLIGQIARGRVVCGGGLKRAGALVGGAFEFKGAGEHGVEVVGQRAAAVGAEHEAVGTGACAAGGGGRAARAAAAGDGGGRPAKCAGDQAGRDAAEDGTGMCAQDVGIGDVEVDARNGDVVIILESEGDGVAQAEVELAIAEQVVEPGRVAETRQRNSVGV